MNLKRMHWSLTYYVYLYEVSTILLRHHRIIDAPSFLPPFNGTFSRSQLPQWSNSLLETNEQLYSQGKQDGISNNIFELIGSTNKYCVEFGFGYIGEFGEGRTMKEEDLKGGTKKPILSGLNTQLLITKGWNHTFFDAEFGLPNINLRKAVLTVDNIGYHFRQAEIPLDVDYVSIDVDSIDAWLLYGLLRDGYRPRVISVEYNVNFHPGMLITCEEKWHRWTGHSVFGASAGTINLIGSMYGYTMVHIMADPPLDVFLVRSDILSSKCSLHSLPSFSDLSKRGKVWKRAHPSCTPEDAARLVSFPLELMGLTQHAHREALRNVMRINDLNPDNKMCNLNASQVAAHSKL